MATLIWLLAFWQSQAPGQADAESVALLLAAEVDDDDGADDISWLDFGRDFLVFVFAVSGPLQKSD